MQESSGRRTLQWMVFHGLGAGGHDKAWLSHRGRTKGLDSVDDSFEGRPRRRSDGLVEGNLAMAFLAVLDFRHQILAIMLGAVGNEGTVGQLLFQDDLAYCLDVFIQQDIFGTNGIVSGRSLETAALSIGATDTAGFGALFRWTRRYLAGMAVNQRGSTVEVVSGNHMHAAAPGAGQASSLVGHALNSTMQVIGFAVFYRKHIALAGELVVKVGRLGIDQRI